MPPKAQTLSIQLKRDKQTFIVSLKQSDSIKVSDIKKQLVSVIQSIGGISDQDPQEDELDDIDIPIPTFGDDSDEDEDVKVDLDNNEVKQGKVIPKLDEIILGKPLNDNEPFDDKFNDLNNDEKLKLKDFQVLSFRLQDESFNVVQPNADD